MTKAERRIRDFSSGLKKLSDKSQNYINKLAHNLFLIEQSSAYPVFNKKYPELENRNTREIKG